MDLKSQIITDEQYFIDVLNVLNPVGNYSSNNNNAQQCPCHNGKGGSDSFSWHEEGNVWKGKCFSCGISGDIIDIYAQAKGLDVKDPGDFKRALNELADILNIKDIKDNRTPIKKEKVSNKKTEKILTDQEIEILTGKAHENVGKTDYFKKRGFTDDTIETYNLGYAPSYKVKGFDNGPAAIVPYPNENYFFTRIISPRGKLKKIFMTGKALPIFNKDAINDNDIIFVTEGQFDCLSILQIGFPCVGTNSVAGNGKLMKYLKDDEIKDKVFIVAYDADEAGDIAAEKLISLLEGEGFKAIRYRPSGGKDINEMLVKCKDQLVEDLVNIYSEAEELLEPLVCVETESSIDGHKIMVDISGEDIIQETPDDFIDVSYKDVNDTPVKKEVVSVVQEPAQVEIVEEQENVELKNDTVENVDVTTVNNQIEQLKEEPNNYSYGQYIFNGKYIYYEKTDKDGEVVETIIIYNGSLDIISSNTDIDTNEETLVLRSRMFGREAETSIKKGLLSKSTFAEEINNQKGFLIPPRNSMDVRDYIATQYRCLLSSNTLVEKLVTGKIGWIKYNNKDTFIYPRPELSIDGKIYYNENTTISERFKSKGDLEKYMDSVLYPLLTTKIGVIAISATVGSLLLEKLNAHESFILDIFGKNGKGKTILLFALASMLGNPRDYTLEWNSTKTAIISNASDLNNFPLLLDDTKKCANKEMIAEVVYSLSGGKDKARANQDGSSREQKTFKNITISTGETSLLNYLEGESSGAGAYGRVISIDTDQYEIFNNKEEADTLINYCTKNYGHFGFEFCKWMFTFLEDKDNLASLNSKYMNYMNMYCDLVEHHTTIRKAKHIALLHAACDLLIDFLNLSYKKIEIDANDIFMDLLEVSEKNSREQDIYLNAYEDVVEQCYRLQDRIHIASRDGSFPPPRVVGWLKDNVFYILDKELVNDILEQHGDFNDILKEWRLRGYMITDTGKLQKTSRTSYKTDGKTRSIKTYAIDTKYYDKANKPEDENLKIVK